LGSRDAAMNTDSVTRRSKWLAENVSTYQIENGRAVKINQKPSSPQAWAEVTGEHVFAPEHQAKAKELIQTLADKQGEREAEQKRMRNIKTAQRVIDTANSPKETQNRAA
jgi:predicted oxidoreductase